MTATASIIRADLESFPRYKLGRGILSGPELLDPELDQNDESERWRNVRRNRELMLEVKDASLSGRHLEN